jgi:enediyne biosynthesis protein E4
MFSKSPFLLIALIGFALTTCTRPTTVFTKLSSSDTGIDFENKLPNRPHFNILYYLYYYNGGGVAVGDINNDGLEDLYFSANSRGGNKLYLNKGNFEFEDITLFAGVAGNADWCTGVSMADVNGDGWLDIYVSSVSGKYGLSGHNELYINNGNNKFSEQAMQYGLNTSCFTTQTAFFDYDHDGDLDCYQLNQSHQPHANITDTSGRRKSDSLTGDKLFRNDVKQTGKFIEVSAAAGIYQSSLGYGLGIAIADFNNDGWEDIYIGNDFHENDYYYLNNGNGSFSESGTQHFGHYSRFSMGNDAADFNNDAQLDLITVDMLPPNEEILKTYGSDENQDTYKAKLLVNGYQHQYSKNCLQRNNGNGISFSETALQSGVAATDWSWAPLFADFDNDGLKDLFISSGIVKRPVDLDYIRYVSDLKMKGLDRTDKYDQEAIDAMPDGASHPYFFRNKDGMHFEDLSTEWGTASMKGYFNGAVYSDLNNDGRLDMVINPINAKAVVLQNNAVKKSWITVSCKSDSGNRYGVGCRIFIFSNGGVQYQQHQNARGFQSSVGNSLHFGMGDAKLVDSLLVVWPDNTCQIARQVATNQKFIAYKKNATEAFDWNRFFPQRNAPYIAAAGKIDWLHKENDFLDYNVQYLIPHLQSTRGPKLAVADVNGDGLDDFYACGARNQPGVLMIQQPDGLFAAQDTALFAKDAICEDVDALFFDANADGSKDLYVVSGGNEAPYNAKMLEDRLYLNDGKGHFKKKSFFLTQRYENKSCVAAADIDKDGDIDLFVGCLNLPGGYGTVRPSYFFLNDGLKDSVHFTGAFNNVIPLENLGMVTSACFVDVNKDTWPDLVVVGEWMSVTIFENRMGKFVKKELPVSTGLWQNVFAADVNEDGYLDLLVGNWGHNNKFYSGKNGPLKMYVKDFDNNGSVEQIVCYTINGKEYPFLAKDELERPLPVLKKAYLNYSEVAGKTVQYIFFDLFKDYTTLQAELLTSSCFVNDGKGNFTRFDLPDELQLAPVMTFAADIQNKGFIAAGNFFGTIPYEGRYDALLPTGFYFDRAQQKFNIQYRLPLLTGEARDMKWLKTREQTSQKLLLARNNLPLIELKKNNNL